MGTTYTIFAKGALRIELDEMSNRFSLDLTGKAYYDEPDSISVSNEPELMSLDAIPSMGAPEVEAMCSTAATRRNLTPTDVVGMALEMLKVATYWADQDDLATFIKDYATKDGYIDSELLALTEPLREAKAR